MTVAPDLPPAALQLVVDYVPPDSLAHWLEQPDTLAVFGFGVPAPASSPDPRFLQVPLPALATPMLELWRSAGPTTRYRRDGIAISQDPQLQFGVLELAETDGDILLASEQAYARLRAFWRDSGYPHLLRVWNYLDAITDGDDDAERYRQFCVGRVRGLGPVDTGTLPAATAIGCRDGRRVLQVYWLAAREPGLPLENPRQVSAYHYPRQYGPQSPSFARALLPPASADMPLMLSGTASIVGHASRHLDSLHAQLDETLANLDSLITAARAHRPGLPSRLDASSRLKVYVRDAADGAEVERHLRTRLGADVPLLLLHADVCRRELMVEIEGMHGLRPID